MDISCAMEVSGAIVVIGDDTGDIIDGLPSFPRLTDNVSLGISRGSSRMPFRPIFTLMPRFQSYFVTEYASGLGAAFVFERRFQISEFSLSGRFPDELFPKSSIGPISTFSAVNQSFDDKKESPPALFQEMGCLTTSIFSGSQIPRGRGPHAYSC